MENNYDLSTTLATNGTSSTYVNSLNYNMSGDASGHKLNPTGTIQPQLTHQYNSSSTAASYTNSIEACTTPATTTAMFNSGKSSTQYGQSQVQMNNTYVDSSGPNYYNNNPYNYELNPVYSSATISTKEPTTNVSVSTSASSSNSSSPTNKLPNLANYTNDLTANNTYYLQSDKCKYEGSSVETTPAVSNHQSTSNYQYYNGSYSGNNQVYWPTTSSASGGSTFYNYSSTYPNNNSSYYYGAGQYANDNPDWQTTLANHQTEPQLATSDNYGRNQTHNYDCPSSLSADSPSPSSNNFAQLSSFSLPNGTQLIADNGSSSLDDFNFPSTSGVIQSSQTKPATGQLTHDAPLNNLNVIESSAFQDSNDYLKFNANRSQKLKSKNSGSSCKSNFQKLNWNSTKRKCPIKEEPKQVVFSNLLCTICQKQPPDLEGFDTCESCRLYSRKQNTVTSGKKSSSKICAHNCVEKDKTGGCSTCCKYDNNKNSALELLGDEFFSTEKKPASSSSSSSSSSASSSSSSSSSSSFPFTKTELITELTLPPVILSSSSSSSSSSLNPLENLINMNEASMNEMRSLSFDAVLQPHNHHQQQHLAAVELPNSPYSPQSPLINALLKEIELKKGLIRKADSEFKVKEYLIELAKSLFQSIANTSLLDKNNNSGTSYVELCSSLKNLKDLSRSVLIAYSYLIDTVDSGAKDESGPARKCGVLLLLSYDLTNYEKNLINLLKRIYSRKKCADSTCNSQFQFNADLNVNLTNSVSYNSTPYYYNSNYYDNSSTNSGSSSQMLPSSSSNSTSTSSYSTGSNFDLMDESHVNGHVEYVTDEATTAARKCSYGLNEIKMIHFILLLFSSIVDLDQFMQISEREKCKSTVCAVDLSHCQKLILQLIDHMCKDKFVKTKILLSLSEIVDVY